ncbi:MAG: hypothetical protein JNJ46_16990 [Myxococcales bacterium]|nr:hypothetical protein [Myxococcales bacterium]
MSISRPAPGQGTPVEKSAAGRIELMDQNGYVEAEGSGLDTLARDAQLLQALISSLDPNRRDQEFEFKLTARLRKHMSDAGYWALSERLKALKERHEHALLISVELLGQLLELAHELIRTEKVAPLEGDEDRGKAALIELFQQVRNEKTLAMLRRSVGGINGIVRLVRFPGWQGNAAGGREGRQPCVRPCSSTSFIKTPTNPTAPMAESPTRLIETHTPRSSVPHGPPPTPSVLSAPPPGTVSSPLYSQRYAPAQPHHRLPGRDATHLIFRPACAYPSP